MPSPTAALVYTSLRVVRRPFSGICFDNLYFVYTTIYRYGNDGPVPSGSIVSGVGVIAGVRCVIVANDATVRSIKQCTAGLIKARPAPPLNAFSWNKQLRLIFFVICENVDTAIMTHSPPLTHHYVYCPSFQGERRVLLRHHREKTLAGPRNRDAEQTPVRVSSGLGWGVPAAAGRNVCGPRHVRADFLQPSEHVGSRDSAGQIR